MPDQALWDLLHAGDWACANADDEALARVATTLAARLSGRQQLLAVAVAAAAPLDMDDATLRWGVLTDELRADAAHAAT
jgi:hypothetical protein